MANVLIVYYSFSGTTRAAAETLAHALGADLVEIRDRKPRRGLGGVFRSIRESLTGAAPDIDTDAHHPLAHRLVVLATPVWAARPASPMRTYINAHRTTLPKVAFLCTLDGSGAQATLDRLSGLVGKSPVATLSLSAEDRKSDADRDVLAAFATRLRAVTADADLSPTAPSEAATSAEWQR